MKIIGHRGARGLAPENTLAALKKGLEHNVDMLEFDLRVTKDGVVILNHDAFVADQSGKRLPIKNSSYKELKDHKKDLTTFKEVLDNIGHPVTLYVEVKPGEPTKPIIDIIKDYLAQGWRSEYFLLGSFNQATLLSLHAGLPDVPTIVIERWSGVRAHLRARQLNTKLIAISSHWLWFGFIKSVSRSGYQLYTFTLNDPVKARRWQRYGLAGVVTDYPDRFTKV